MTANVRRVASVLGSHIDALSWQEAIGNICMWAQNRESRYVVLCNVHSVVTALLEDDHRDSLNGADMVAPDGMPVTWVLRKLGFTSQQRINGPDLMWKYCEEAEKTDQKIFFYGSTNAVLTSLESCLKAAFPELHIAGMYAPPFRDLTAIEDAEIIERVNLSGANVVFIGLGCPRQERWMLQHRGKLNAVMLGVGAAFDYHAGTIKRSPKWMQNLGFEWLYRLASDPKRLWKRYLITNSIFIFAIAAQLLGIHKFKN